MAEKRNPAGDTSRAVPKARTAEPDRADPPRPRKAAKPATAAKPAKETVAKAKPATAKATVAKATKKATKAARAAAPAKPAAAVEAAAPVTVAGNGATTPGPAPTGTGPVPPGAWAAAGWAALPQLDQPPERIAELAVAELGPRAAAWAGWLRATYPDAPPYGIARLAARDARRAGLVLAVAEGGGPVAAAISLPAAAWVRGTMVLRIAAAYGHDPTDPRRAGELLALLGLAGPAGTTAAGHRPVGLTRVVGRLGLTRLVARRLGLRRTVAATALRVLAAASDHGERIDRLAHRAARYYRGTLAPRDPGA